MEGSTTESQGQRAFGVDTSVPALREWRWGFLDARRRARGARLVLLACCLGIIVWYVSLALRVDGNNDNDAAYYLGVARYMARTGRFEENIVWHFLARHTSVFHPPFDYWQGLTSLILVPVLLVFRGPQAPFVFMALVSGSALLLLWYLVTSAAPLAHPLAQAVTLFTFALSPAMIVYRVDTDTVPLTQVWLTGSLVALASRRLKTAACVAFLMVWTRGDGTILCAMIWTACLFSAWKSASSPTRAMAPLVATMLSLATTYAAACLWLHGRVPALAVRQAPRLYHYYDLYAFGHAPRLLSWKTRFQMQTIGHWFWATMTSLQSTAFAPLHDLWLAIVLVVGSRIVRWRLVRTVWTILFLGAPIIVFTSGLLFSHWRTLYTMLPLIALAGGATVDELLDRSSRVASVALGRRLGPWVVTGLGAALCVGLFSTIECFPAPKQELAAWNRDLRALSPLLGAQTVAAVRPWSVIANTESPAVMIPVDGAEAVENAFKFYRVQWLILSGELCLEATEEVCVQIRDGTRNRLGSLQLTEYPGAGDLRLFRIQEQTAQNRQ
jgi:hypothetical protein